MNIKQKLMQLSIIAGIVASFAAAVPVVTVHAAECAGVKTSIIPCSQPGGDNVSARDSGVWGILLLVLNILTAGVGIAAVGGIVYAAILYASASDRAEQVKQAKDTIQNVVIGIAAYAGLYLFLNFIIPGGIFT